MELSVKKGSKCLYILLKEKEEQETKPLTQEHIDEEVSWLMKQIYPINAKLITEKGESKGIA